MLQSFFLSMGITDIWQLISATMIFLLLPGPGTLCILMGSGKNGWRGGFASLAGVLLGDILLMTLAAAGVAAVLHANPLLFKGLQYSGCAYLVYLGLRLVFAKQEGNGRVLPFSSARDFRRGFLITLINPKAIVFYMAFFPLFIDVSVHQGNMTFLVMGMVICCCTLLYGSLLVLVGNVMAGKLSGQGHIVRMANRIAGMVLVAFGIRLAAG